MDDTRDQGSRLYLILVTLVATVGGFLFGYDTLIISGANIFITNTFELDPTEMGFAVSSIIIGSLIGTIIAGFVSDRLGRKKTLLLAALLFGVSAVGTALPKTFFQFNVFRILGGVGMGVAMIISPIYIAEISPARIRGPLVTLNQFVIVTGGLMATLVAWRLAIAITDETLNWRWMMGSVIIPVVVLIIGLFFVPESPRWLVEKERNDDALHVLTKISGRAQAEVEVGEIAESITEEKQQESSSFRELLRPGIRMALIIACGVAILQQFSGGMPLAMYAPIIFQNAGFPDPAEAIGLSVLIFVWSLVCVVIALVLVERMGRKRLLYIGLSGMVLGHVLLSLCFQFEWWGYYVPVILILTNGMSNISISPLGWVIMAEIFPTRIRGTGMAVATFILFLSSYINIQLFPGMKSFFEDKTGLPGGVFLVFAVICVLGIIFIWRIVPETKGKSLEQIASLWLRKQKQD